MRARTPMAWGYSLILILVGICLGLLLQVRVEPTVGVAAGAEYEEAQIQAAVQRLDEEQLGLKDAISDLRDSLERHQKLAATETESLAELRQELATQRMRAGLTPLTGSGVVIILDDSDTGDAAANADLSPYIVHEYDVRDVVNLLWLAGAEAVAVNGERLVSGSSTYCVGSTIMVNDTRLSPPYTVRAIGSPEALYSVATDPAYLADLRRRAGQYGLELKVDWQERLDVPAFKGSFAFEYARAGGL